MEVLPTAPVRCAPVRLGSTQASPCPLGPRRRSGRRWARSRHRPGRGSLRLPGLHPAAIEPDEGCGDVDVLVAVCTRPVADRHPGGGLHALPLEPIASWPCGRSLPTGRRSGGDRRLGATSEHVPDVPAGRVRPVGVVGGIECRTEVGDLSAGLRVRRLLASQGESRR